MNMKDILKDAQFEAVTETKVDAKHRITLGQVLSDQISSFRIYRNAHGQIILDPMVSIPANEAWLFKNKRAAEMVKKGLEDARKGKLIDAGEDFSKYLDDED